MSEVPARVRVTSLRLDRLGGRGSILEEDLMSFLLEITGLLRSGAASSTTTFSTVWVGPSGTQTYHTIPTMTEGKEPVYTNIP
jgi:hypothetical protein